MPAAAALDCPGPGGEVRIRAGEGHSLPWHAADWCAGQIQNWAEGL
jgi:hypothetical protein